MPFKSKLKDRKIVADLTAAVWLEKSANFSFRPGQYMQVVLPELLYPDPRGDGRVFCMASSPRDADLLIAFRLSDSGYKRTFMEMRPGAEVEIDGPFGGFLLPQDSSRPLVFIAGGIGVTPFRSMVKHVVEENLPHSITLLYSNPSLASSAFLDDFSGWEKDRPHFRMISTATNEAPSPLREGKFGRIDAAFIEGVIPDVRKPLYYIAGPPLMVRDLIDVLAGMGVPRDNIRGEKFSGY